MKGIYVIAIVALMLLIIGCSKPAAPEAAPVQQQPAVTEPVAPVEEAAQPASTTGAQQTITATDAMMEQYKAACQKGSVKMCIVLKSKYGIDMQPGTAAEQETAEPAETTTG